MCCEGGGSVRHPEFVLEPPEWRFNVSNLDKAII